MSPTDTFFTNLSQWGHQPNVQKLNGSIRFDLDSDHWLVTFAKGTIRVSPMDGPADSVLRTDRSTFDGFLTGEINPMAATLRGLVDLEGDPEMIVLFQRLMVTNS
jgi:putative sterol carrier protein